LRVLPTSFPTAAFPNTPNPAREEALSSWFEISGEVVEPLSNLQRAWEAPILEKISTSLIANADSLTSEARIRASLRKESGAWLNALPCAPLGTFMDNDTGLVSFKPAKHYRTHLTDQLENFITQCYILVEQPGKKLFVYSFFSAQNPASRHLRREFILGI
jgi:hypothetical protein